MRGALVMGAVMLRVASEYVIGLGEVLADAGHVAHAIAQQGMRP